MLEFIAARGNYWLIIALMMTGLYITFEANNLIKRLVGLSVFQTSVFLFYITLGKVAGGTAPILMGGDIKKHGKGHGEEAYSGATGADAAHGIAETGYGDGAAGHGAGAAHSPLENIYSNPLPHVLILTAIVVGVATLAVGLALVVRIREAYGTIEADEVRQIDIDVALAEELDTPGAEAAQ